MKSIFQIVLILGFVMSAFSATPEIDFDGKNNKSTNLESFIKKVSQNNSVSSRGSVIESGGVSNEEGDGIATIRLFAIKKNGKEELVQPTLTAEGKKIYEFRPNANRYWEFSCTGQNPRKWNVTYSVDFHPEEAGHNHSSAGILSWVVPDSDPNALVPKLLPTKIGKQDIPGNTPFRIYFKAPVYATHVFEKIEFTGWCQGVTQNETFVRVTAQNLIELKELEPEPYFKFKIQDPATFVAHNLPHFATPDTIAKFKQIAWEYNQQFAKSDKNSKLVVNDMGLIWGGRYNYDSPLNCWANGQRHYYHRYGRQMDIHTLSMSLEQRGCLKEIACKYQVRPMFEGKALYDLLHHNYSNPPLLDIDALERTIHYHLNFARPTDMFVVPPDDNRPSPCPPGPVPAEKSACPKPLGLIPLR